jgi:hypothetical protein
MIRLGLRLTLNGGREAVVRLLITTAAVALGVGLLLMALAGMSAINAQNGRDAWLTATFGPAQRSNLPGASNLPANSAGNPGANGSYTGPPPSAPGSPLSSASSASTTPAATGSATDPLWWLFSAEQFGSQTIDRVDVAVTGPSSPVPPGISHLPGPGEFYASPALSRLLRSTPAAELADRFPGQQIGIIGPSALPSPDSLIAVVGYSASQLSKAPGARQISAINTDPRFGGPNGFDATELQVILAVGALALLLPVLVFIGTATRLAAARREQRFAAMRLVGATPRQVSVISAVEASIAALAGVILGFGVFFLLRPALTNVPFTGAPFAPGDLSLSMIDIVLVAIGVPLAAGVAAHFALRRVQISPLGVTRHVTPPNPRAYRLVPLLAGIGELVYLAAVGSPSGTGGQIGAYFLGGLLVMGGLVVAGPWLTLVGARLMALRTGRPAVLLAGRRLADNPRGAFRSISGLILALFVTTVSIGVITTILDYQGVTSGTSASKTLIDQPLAPLPSTPDRLIAQLRSIPGVQGVTILYSQPGASQDGLGLSVKALVSCAELLHTPALGRCAPGANVATITGTLLSGALTAKSTFAGTVWPTSSVSPAHLLSLPTQAIAVGTNGSTAVIERTRTRLEVDLPNQRPPSTLGEISAQDLRKITELKQMTSVVIVISLVIAGCSLMVSVIAGVSDRKRPFSLLRLTGVPIRVLRRVVELEAAVPLLASAVLSIAAGFLAAELFLRSQLGESLQPPELGYYVLVAAGLLASLGIIASTLPLIERITGPEIARND